MQPGLGCPGRDVEDDGRLRERQPDVEVQDEDGPLVDREPIQFPLETVTFRQRRLFVYGASRLMAVSITRGPTL